ncbi:MAG: hypothetical protein OXR66_03085 [Candidatus Woesearchaeota archaeon]|nr:hypothetical protein [Candidatus Woesearchaeota archaeon]
MREVRETLTVNFSPGESGVDVTLTTTRHDVDNYWGPKEQAARKKLRGWMEHTVGHRDGNKSVQEYTTGNPSDISKVRDYCADNGIQITGGTHRIVIDHMPESLIPEEVGKMPGPDTLTVALMINREQRDKPDAVERDAKFFLEEALDMNQFRPIAVAGVQGQIYGTTAPTDVLLVQSYCARNSIPFTDNRPGALQ